MNAAAGTPNVDTVRACHAGLRAPQSVTVGGDWRTTKFAAIRGVR